MTDPSPQSFVVEDDQAGTIVSALRKWLPGHSWSAVRRLLRSRHVAVNGALCVDEARRLQVGEAVSITSRALPPPPGPDDLEIRLIDPSIVVVDKPSGMVTVRRASERTWPRQRKNLQPTLDEAVALRMARHRTPKSRSGGKLRLSRLLAAHRIDRDTSGLVIFARDQVIQQKLIKQFSERTVDRTYVAVVPGRIKEQTLRSRLVRDRGDGLRGSSEDTDQEGEVAITHVRMRRALGPFAEIECRLETGRTNQIRIHLAEAGQPICGDIKYRGPLGGPEVRDQSGAPRLALHATRLGLKHPVTGEELVFESVWPVDMERFLRHLTRQGKGDQPPSRRF